MDLRTTLTRAGWAYPTTNAMDDIKSSLLPQEMTGKREYLKVLFSLLEHIKEEDLELQPKKRDARMEMIELVKRVLGEFLQWSRHNCSVDIVDDRASTDEKWRTLSYKPVVVEILVHFARMSVDELKLHLKPWLYPLLIDLVRSNDKDIRNALFDLLGTKVASLVLS
jgi:brefeldin A-inhibited guanine nucleotide-exchange protein